MSVVLIKRLASAGVRGMHPAGMAAWTRNLLDSRRKAGSSREHLTATMQWLRAADDASPEGGVAGGYSMIDGWLDPYPETTGYIIPTFFDYAALTGDTEWRGRAIAMAEWEIDVQLASGAVQAGLYRGKGAKQVPAVFNTGQVILGWCRTFTETGNVCYLDAAKKAGDWLIDLQSEDGAWRFKSQETETTVHAYDVRTAWSLLEIFKLTDDVRYWRAATANIEWTMGQQTENGWFENNAFFTNTDKWTAPFTHNIAYVMEGLQEAYRILKDEEYLASYSKTAEKLLRIYELRKNMAGDFDSKWKSSSNYSCLTGSAQIAGVWLRHYEITGDLRFLNAALKLSDDVKACQNISSLHRGIAGGVQGSFPITGKYTPYVFPNWAAKFFADTLMLEEKVMAIVERRVRAGEKLC